jgi:hypothetical protein
MYNEQWLEKRYQKIWDYMVFSQDKEIRDQAQEIFNDEKKKSFIKVGLEFLKELEVEIKKDELGGRYGIELNLKIETYRKIENSDKHYRVETDCNNDYNFEIFCLYKEGFFTSEKYDYALMRLGNKIKEIIL